MNSSHPQRKDRYIQNLFYCLIIPLMLMPRVIVS